VSSLVQAPLAAIATGTPVTSRRAPDVLGESVPLTHVPLPQAMVWSTPAIFAEIVAAPAPSCRNETDSIAALFAGNA
jgi:hypothetical protein